MEEDCDRILVIDLEDEQDGEKSGNSNTHETQINNNNKLVTNIKTRVESHSNEQRQETDENQSNNEEHNSDDYIQVIDDDVEDEYENSAQKLINALNKVQQDYHKNKQLHEQTNYQMLQTNNDKFTTLSTKEGVRNRLRDHRVCNKSAVGRGPERGDVSRDRLVYCVNEGPPLQRTSHNPPVYEPRYAGTGDEIRVANENYYGLLRTGDYVRNVPTAFCRKFDTNRPAPALDMNDYHTAVSRHTYNHDNRPEIAITNNGYRNVNRVPCLRSESLRIDASRYGATNNDVYHPAYVTSKPEDSMSIDIGPYRNVHRPEGITLSKYRHSAVDRNTYNYSYRPHERLIADDYIHGTTNRFLQSGAYRPDTLNGYWQSRHAYRPEELVCIDNNDPASRDWRTHDNSYISSLALNSDHYRPMELPNHYIPNINMDNYSGPMLIRNTCCSDTSDVQSCRSHFDAYRGNNDNYYRKNDSATNLSCTHMTIDENANKMADVNTGECKLRTKLHTNFVNRASLPLDKNMSNLENVHMPTNSHQNSETYSPKAIDIENNKTTLTLNIPNSTQLDAYKPGVPIRTNRPDTVILSTKDIHVKSMLVETGDLANNNFRKMNEDIENTGSALSINAKSSTGNGLHDEENMHIEKEVDRKINEVIRQKNYEIARENTRFLAVFFTRVKELVKETFQEFSKSLECEIKTLGRITSDGKIKTDIQYICPLYCSVSTFYLPRFDNMDSTDSRIEKHINRDKICDLCSCIQNCYKLYKTNYFNLISTKTSKRNEHSEYKDDGIKKSVDDGVNMSRAQSVICRRKGTDSKENGDHFESKNYLEINDESFSGNEHSNAKRRKIHEDAQGSAYAKTIGMNPLDNLDKKTLLDSLSVLAFIPSLNNIEKLTQPPKHKIIVSFDDSVNIQKNMDREKMDTENCNKNMCSQIKGIVEINKVQKNNDQKDVDEENLVIALSSNEITNAAITSKLKNKSGKKPDTVFTCHICTCIFTYFMSFVSHMQKEHDIKGIDEEIPEECIARKCPFCGIYSKQKYHNDHVKRAHPQIFTLKGEPCDIDSLKDNNIIKRKCVKRKFIFTCLVCNKNLKSREVKRHREKEHKGLNVTKMFTKKLSNMD